MHFFTRIAYQCSRMEKLCKSCSLPSLHLSHAHPCDLADQTRFTESALLHCTLITSEHIQDSG